MVRFLLWISVFALSLTPVSSWTTETTPAEPCGGDLGLDSENGTFHTPNYPNYYPNNAFCRWNIFVSDNAKILLEFKHINLQRGSGCRFDSIKVFEGFQYVSRTLMENWCGFHAHLDFVSIGSNITVEFRSDGSDTYRGFNASWSKIAVTCGGDLGFDSENGTFHSPNYPNNYPNNAFCRWNIFVSDNAWVHLEFTDVDVQGSSGCPYESIKVFEVFQYGRRTLMEHWCSSNEYLDFVSIGSNITVEFRSDQRYTYRGFNARWSKIAETCGGDLGLDSENGTFHFPNYPNIYPDNAFCRWNIFVRDNERIRLEFTDVDLEGGSGCQYNSIKVFQYGTRRLRKIWCGSHRYLDSVDGTNITVEFRSDTGLGFNARWSKIGWWRSTTTPDWWKTDSSASSGWWRSTTTPDWWRSTTTPAVTCGGDLGLDSESGTFHSPNYPNNYPNDALCRWNIFVSDNASIHLEFTDVDLEDGYECHNDSIKVFELFQYGRRRLMENWCGSHRYLDFVSIGSNITVEFKSDQRYTSRGFNARWSKIAVTCGDDLGLDSENGTFHSPNYPYNYPDDAFCRWNIFVTDNASIHLEFTDVNVDGVYECHHDSIKVFVLFQNGTRTLMEKWCGSHEYLDFVSNGTDITVEFRSVTYWSGRGFYARWSKIDDRTLTTTEPCGGDLGFDSESGTFHSPNYPSNYPNNAFCRWNIFVSDNASIHLEFTNVDLGNSYECHNDSIKVFEVVKYGPRRLMETWCGSHRYPDFVSIASNATVEFKSDQRYTYRGFNARWSKIDNRTLTTTGWWRSTTTPNWWKTDSSASSGWWRSTTTPAEPCGGDLGLDSESGTFHSPNYPYHYPRITFCRWNIFVSDNASIHLEFTDVDLQRGSGCLFDSIKVFQLLQNGTRTLMKTRCGYKRYLDFVSIGSNITVEYRSGQRYTYGGFNARWSKIAETCGGDLGLDSESGTFHSPNYPNIYPRYAFCRWNIFVNDNKKISLEFTDVHLDGGSGCRYNSIKVFMYRTRRLYENWCGYRRSLDFVYIGSNMTVEFRSDGTYTGRGFNARWWKTDNRTLTTTDWPTPSPSTDWKTTSRSTAPDFCASNHCGRHGYCDNWRRSCQCSNGWTGKFCDKDINECLDETNGGCDQVCINTQGSRYCSCYPGFSGHGTQCIAMNNCSRSYQTSKGFILSPNFPNQYNLDTFCSWVIQVQSFEIVKLTFYSPFGLEPDHTCRYDSVEVYDVLPGGNRQSLGTWCGYNTPPELTSTGSRMVVEFSTDYKFNANGFSASWTSVTHCGGILLNKRGNISSPNYPRPYMSGVDCEWDIRTTRGRFIRLEFESLFDVSTRDSESCDDDWIEIFDSASEETAVVPRAKLCGSHSPPVIKSFASRLVVRFHSSGYYGYGIGFKASWEAVEECGGVITSENGHVIMSSEFLDSPSRHTSYSDHNSNCTWGINVPEDFIIRLEINQTFNGLPCGDLKIEDYDASHRPITSDVCFSNNSSMTVTSKSNGVKVLYQPTHNNSFFASWTIGCGGPLTDRRGTFHSPDYPRGYRDNLDCRWEIRSPYNSRVIRLWFDADFQVELNHEGCISDYVEVFDTPNESLVSVGKFCGRETPPLIVSYFSKLVVIFHSDGSKTGRGFKASWDFEHSCGDMFTANQGQLSFPNINYTYPDRENCDWDIRVDAEYVVRLEFNGKFQLERGADRLTVSDVDAYGKTKTIGSYSGSSRPRPLISKSSHVRLNFHSDGSVRQSGFDVSWVASCGGTFNQKEGNITSPNYTGSGYSPNLDCQWEITVDTDHQVHLYFNQPFELEGSDDGTCEFDYLEIIDVMPSGYHRSRGKYCGHQAPPYMTSSTSKMLVKFHSDLDKPGQGFSAFWDSECGETYHDRSGNFTSPRYPSPYPHNFDCRWVIQVDQGNSIRLTFKDPFFLEPNNKCDYDYVEIYDYDLQDRQVKVGRWCGKDMPSDVKSTGNKMAVKFRSDGKKSDVGFQAFWETECGGVYFANQGNFSSPLYPGGYPGNLQCRWEIDLNPGQTVRLEFESNYELEMNKECGYDSLELFDSFSNGSLVSRGKWCGLEKPPTVTSFNSRLVILFTSDMDKNGVGFSAKWETVRGCGGTFEEASGYIMSPNYPSGYPDDANCRWIINTGYNQTTLHFDPLFGIEEGFGCGYDYLQIENDYGFVSKRCGNSSPQSMTFVNGGKVEIVFRSDKSTNGNGFFLTWTSY